jgi:hypothetical protein
VTCSGLRSRPTRCDVSSARSSSVPRAEPRRLLERFANLLCVKAQLGGFLHWNVRGLARCGHNNSCTLAVRGLAEIDRSRCGQPAVGLQAHLTDPRDGYGQGTRLPGRRNTEVGVAGQFSGADPSAFGEVAFGQRLEPPGDALEEPVRLLAAVVSPNTSAYRSRSCLAVIRCTAATSLAMFRSFAGMRISHRGLGYSGSVNPRGQ